MENTKTKISPELRGKRQDEEWFAGVGSWACFFLLLNSVLTHCLALVKLNNPLSLTDSGCARIILFSYFARLLKAMH